MDLNDMPLFGALSRRMQWLNKRQSVLAENVSNANTPSYRARDLAPQTFKELMRGETDHIAVRRTNDSHKPGTLEGASGAGTVKEDYDILPSGNSVNLEEEMVKVAETQISYRTITALYQKQMGLLKIAIGKGR